MDMVNSFSYSINADTVLKILQGDITQARVDAVVNAANQHLRHFGGLAAAIVKAGGEIVQKESSQWVQEYGPVPHDNPAFTSAGRMPCTYIIHAVGPVWGSGDEDHKLSTAIQGSINRARELNCKSIAFPAISTGIFGFPMVLAAKTFRDTLFSLHQTTPLKEIQIILLDQKTTQIFINTFQETSR